MSIHLGDDTSVEMMYWALNVGRVLAMANKDVAFDAAGAGLHPQYLL